MSAPLTTTGSEGGSSPWLAQLLARSRAGHVTAIDERPASPGTTSEWPAWTAQELRQAWAAQGITRPWSHQVEAAEIAHSGRSVVVATGTASGKSLAYWLPSLTNVIKEPESCSVLHLSPTKALAADQHRALRAIAPDSVRSAVYDGDTPTDERQWARKHANYLLTNPDMLHHGLLPGSARWTRFLRSLRYVVIDEAHSYRGTFGAHTALLMRRLSRAAESVGAAPVYLLASATMAEPAMTASTLVGHDVLAVDTDGSARGARTFALWAPPPVSPSRPDDAVALRGSGSMSEQETAAESEVADLAPARRSAIAETADLVADLTIAGARLLAFVRSRRAAEAVAQAAQDIVAEIDTELPAAIAAYRGGYLPEERRQLEEDLRTGRLRALATTNALELGIDVTGLDAVIVSGWPGTRASVFQQAGRAGRSGEHALAILVARDDPLDQYVLQHPEALFGRPLEQTVFDPDNPYVLAPHLCAAAAESALTEDGINGIDRFGPRAREVADALVKQGALRRRTGGWFWTSRDRASDLADLRGTGGAPFRIVEEGTGRLLGTIDAGSRHTFVHPGAIYVHQGDQYFVVALDEDDAVAVARPVTVDYSTHARTRNDVSIVDTFAVEQWGQARLHLGVVDATSQTVAFARRRMGTGELLGESPLDLEPSTLRTVSVWWTLTESQVRASGVTAVDVPGATHAAEHASIGLLPLLATCDRWDLGGLSTALHPDTGMLTVFVHDAVAGGSGFAERGFRSAAQWLSMTRSAIAECPCTAGCPSCIQSPKCGNGNEPLNKQGAIRLLDTLLAEAPSPPTTPASSH